MRRGRPTLRIHVLLRGSGKWKPLLCRMNVFDSSLKLDLFPLVFLLSPKIFMKITKINPTVCEL